MNRVSFKRSQRGGEYDVVSLCQDDPFFQGVRLKYEDEYSIEEIVGKGYLTPRLAVRE